MKHKSRDKTRSINSINRSIDRSIHLSIDPSIHLSINQSINQSINPAVIMWTYSNTITDDKNDFVQSRQRS